MSSKGKGNPRSSSGNDESGQPKAKRAKTTYQGTNFAADEDMEAEVKQANGSGKAKTIVPECFVGKTYYEILSVEKNATIEEINRAYKRLSLQHHPDRNTSPHATEEFQYLARVHETLAKDPRKRALYDRHGDGIVDEATDAFMDAYEYWKTVFPDITTSDVEAFKAGYIGSDDEKTDLIEAFNISKGDMYEMMVQHLFFADSTAVDYHTKMVRDLVAEGRINDEDKTIKKYLVTFEKSLKGLAARLKAFEEEEAKKAELVLAAQEAMKAALGSKLVESDGKRKGTYVGSKRTATALDDPDDVDDDDDDDDDNDEGEEEDDEEGNEDDDEGDDDAMNDGIDDIDDIDDVDDEEVDKKASNTKGKGKAGPLGKSGNSQSGKKGGTPVQSKQGTKKVGGVKGSGRGEGKESKSDDPAMNMNEIIGLIKQRAKEKSASFLEEMMQKYSDLGFGKNKNNNKNSASGKAKGAEGKGKGSAISKGKAKK